MRTLYVHIGTPKTATTSIQMFCVENQEILNEQGYSYPLLDFVYPHVAHRRNGHFLVGWVYKPGGQEDVEKEQELWEKGFAMTMLYFPMKISGTLLTEESSLSGPNSCRMQKSMTIRLKLLFI